MWLAFDTFIEQVQRKTRTSLKAQIFFPVPDSVLPSVSPADWLFFGDKDLELARRYLWISTAGLSSFCFVVLDWERVLVLAGSSCC